MYLVVVVEKDAVFIALGDSANLDINSNLEDSPDLFWKARDVLALNFALRSI